MEVNLLAENQYKVHSYKIQRTYYKTSKYTLTLFIPPVETLESQSGYTVNPMAILYLALPYDAEIPSILMFLHLRATNRAKASSMPGSIEMNTWCILLPNYHRSGDTQSKDLHISLYLYP